MSAIPQLSRATVLAWRNFANTTAYQEGVEHLRRYHGPKAGGTNEVELVKSAIGWNYYHAALGDLEEVLMKIAEVEKSLDEPSIHQSIGKDDQMDDPPNRE